MSNHNRPILKDADADRQLRELGYVVFPLFSETQTKDLLGFYLANHPEEQAGMSASAHSPDIAFRKKMSDAIHAAVVPALEQHANAVQALGGSFISKSAGSAGSLAPHQDWNITDERQYRSFNLWMPLVDTANENGGIMVLPRSHLMGLNFRGPGIPAVTEHIQESLWEAMETLVIPAGYGLLYDHRLIHASGPNKINDPRIVAVLGMVETDAPMMIFYGEDKKITSYACDPQYFLEKNPNEGPDGIAQIESFNYSGSAPDAEHAREMLIRAGIKLPEQQDITVTPRLGWIRKIFQRLSRS
jgi:hypothetical protein